MVPHNRSIRNLIETQTAGDLVNAANWLAANRFNPIITAEEMVRQVVIRYLIDDYGIEVIK